MAKKETKEVAKVEPARPIAPFEEMERRFENFFRRAFPMPGAPWFPKLGIHGLEEVMPVVDIFEDGSDLVVKAEIPGMKKENIEVKLSDDTVTISGEKKTEEKVGKKNYYRLERSHGSFSRAFSLPSEVQADKAKAQFKDGVLEIRAPKTEEAKQKEKKVAIE
jgi:HSP20 family protein